MINAYKVSAVNNKCWYIWKVTFPDEFSMSDSVELS